LALLTLLVLFVAGFFFWAINSERGTSWLVATVQSQTPLDLVIGGVEGVLADGIVLNDVVLTIDNDRLEVDRVEMHLNLTALVGGSVTFNEIAVTTASYIRGDAPEQSESGGGFSSPVRVAIGSATIESLSIEAETEPVVFTDTSFGMELVDDRLLAQDFATRVEGVDVQADAELHFTASMALSADFVWSRVTDELEARGEGTLAGTLPQLMLDHELSAPFQLFSEGDIVVADTLSVDLANQWENLVIPGQDAVTSPTGSMQLSGNFETFEFSGAGALEIEGMPIDFAADGSGTPASVSLSRLMLSSTEGMLTASGDVNLEPLDWTLDIEVEDFDPGQHFPDWPGVLQGRAHVEGGMEPELAWSASNIELNGTLRALPLSGSGNVSFASNSFEIDDIVLRSGSNIVRSSGSVGAALALSVDADVTEAGGFWPELSGSGRIIAEIGGTTAAPSFDGALSGEALRWREYSVEQLSLVVDAALSDAAPMSIRVDGQGFGWNSVEAESISGSVSGLRENHDIELDVVAVALEFNSGVVSVGEFCVVQNLANVCGAARLSGGLSDSIELQATNFDLQALRPILPEDVLIVGIYDAELSLAGPMSAPIGNFSVSGGSTRVGFRGGSGRTDELRFDELSLVAELDMDDIEVIGFVDAGQAGSMNLAAEINDVSGEDPEIEAVFDASWNDLGIVSILTPDVSDVSGSANVDIAIAGTLREPEIQGRATLNDGSLSIPNWGFELVDVQAEAVNLGDRTIEYNAIGLAGDGEAELLGTTILDADAGWPTEFSVRGESLGIVRLPDAEIDISPDLNVVVEFPRIEVTGAVDIPRATLSLAELPAQASSPSADTVVHGVEITEEFRPLLVQAGLRLTLGDAVTYSGGGLTTFATGELNLNYESGRTAVATGLVEIAGNYEIQSQSLDLERGRLRFAGPLDNPGLDVRAVREIESSASAGAFSTTVPSYSGSTRMPTPITAAGNIRVGVELTGTLRAPETRLFSEPAMSEADALSYMLFGRPLTSTDGAETTTLQSTAVSMGLSQALPVIRRVGETVGLDELTLQTTDADAGELMAGKFLSPRLYVRYTYGLFNRVGGLLVHFRLTDRFSLETRSGDEKSMDILYVIEKD
jgi:translocation and assembly module TamB